MTEFFIKKGDLIPSIQGELKDENGVVVNLTGVTTVQFCYKRYGESTWVTRTAAIVNAVAGTVKYDWVAADTNQAGSMIAEWRVIFPTGTKPSTFPNDGFIIVRVTGGSQ